MKILALETTEKSGSVAVLDGKRILGKTELPKNRRSSQTLHPAMLTLLQQTNVRPAEIGLVAAVAGPGSFTGLRVGITTAKIFAYAVNAEIAAFDTFHVTAAGTEHNGILSIGVDAQRGEVAAGLFRRTTEGGIDTIAEPVLMPFDDWQKHTERYENLMFTGPALERWRQRFTIKAVFAAEKDWFPKAEIAGQLAADRHAAGNTQNFWTLLPIYSRLSAAEEKRNAPVAPNSTQPAMEQ
ncbi:MAG: tRNA (adenosine(37)-N6)-threonylcarbamoyltransferase complex dimerization subunit type 1 TsaB [Planctomycetaceae bacterium]|jgi:tRNA threonylcarbamoyladenosine biosynthesis protein TsaB|nr:tRNA (adenosine(37)-N6)-threonylcarbamoyltransferase complex dimerization subunit type 1 TsaB [Planctomycetaceae bacterium]